MNVDLIVWFLDTKKTGLIEKWHLGFMMWLILIIICYPSKQHTIINTYGFTYNKSKIKVILISVKYIVLDKEEERRKAGAIF